MLRVRVMGETLVDGEFWKKIKPDGLIWTIDTIEKHRVLSINADKYEG
jgi:hypothetical protein